MTDRPNFLLVPDPPSEAPPSAGGLLARLRQAAAGALAAGPEMLLAALGHARPPAETGTPARPRLVFAVDATASREPAWAAARQVTDALVKALPGELDVALAVHGGNRVHTFTPFTADANTLRDRAAGVACQAGFTRLLPILAVACRPSGGARGRLHRRRLRGEPAAGAPAGRRHGRARHKTDRAARHGDRGARRDAEVFWDLAKRTGGCVLAFDAGAVGRLRDLLSAVAVYAVGGEHLLRQRKTSWPARWRCWSISARAMSRAGTAGVTAAFRRSSRRRGRR